MANKTILDLIIAARGGDFEARNELWTIFEGDIRDAHDFSRLGPKWKPVSAFVRPFEDDQERLLGVLDEAIKHYDPQKAAFTTYLGYLVKLRALDEIRRLTNKCVEIGDEKIPVKLVPYQEPRDYDDEEERGAIMPSALEDVLDPVESEKSSQNKNTASSNDEQAETDEAAVDAILQAEQDRKDSAQVARYSQARIAERREFGAEGKIRKLLSHYPENSARRKYLMAYLQAARECEGKDPKTKRICEILGCTRANCSAMAQAIRKDGYKWGIVLRLQA